MGGEKAKQRNSKSDIVKLRTDIFRLWVSEQTQKMARTEQVLRLPVY
jgi:hypothetical protein